MLRKDPYTWPGLGLLIAGGLISLFAYLVLDLIWLTALGLCLLILSFIILALGRTIPKLPPEVCSLLLETGINNMATLVEELGIRAQAIYLPSSLTNGRPQALIPLQSDSSLPAVNRALPQRLIVRYGANPDDIGLLLSTIGSAAVGMLESRPGPTADELASALTTLFVGILGVADGANVIHHENRIKVGIDNPRIENKPTWHNQCLGGPLASVAASVAAEAWDKPTSIKQESYQKGKYSVELEVMG